MLSQSTHLNSLIVNTAWNPWKSSF